jgi:LacI family transcriptional regulator
MKTVPRRPPQTKPPTLKAVAESAGVALATASYALSGRKRGGRISPTVVGRVRRAAERLGYAPSRAARALVSGRARTVAVVLSTPRGVFSHGMAQVLNGLQQVLAERDYGLLLHGAGRDPAALCGELFARRLADAALVLSEGRAPEPAPTRPGRPPPIVLDLMQRGGRRPSVMCDPAPGLVAAADHLLALGHRDLLWVHPSSRQGEAEARRAAVVAALAGKDVRLRAAELPAPASTFFDSDSGAFEGLLVRVASALPRDDLPTAILCWNDRIAFAAREVLATRGVRVPDDVSLVGYDDFIAAWTVPPLSTVHGAFEEIGRAGAEMALRLIERPNAAPEIIRVPSRFIPRATTGPARGVA